MRKSIALVAVLALVATPALAALTPSAFTNVQDVTGSAIGSTVGIMSSGGAGILSNYTMSVPTSVQTATFAFHWPFTGTISTVVGVQFQFSLVWDNSEVMILGTSNAAGNWAGANNHTGITWFSGVTNPSTVQVGDVLGTGVPLWQNPTFGSTTVSFSNVTAFVKVQYQAQPGAGADGGDGLLDLYIGSAALLFNVSTTPGTFWTAGGIGNDTYGFDITPEPASLSLLALGFATTGAGVWRRRRR